MFKVEKYTNPVTFYNTLEIQSDELHLTSIPVLAMHLKDQAVAKRAYHLRWHVYIYHHFYCMFYPNYSNKKWQLDLQQVIRRLIIEHDMFNDYQERLLKQVASLY